MGCEPRSAVVRAHAQHEGNVKSVLKWNVVGALLGVVLGIPLLVMLGSMLLVALREAHWIGDATQGALIVLWIMVSLPMGPLLGEGLARTVAARRARNRAIAPVHARIDALQETPADGSADGLVRLRGRVKMIAPVTSVDGKQVGAFEAFRAVGNELQSASGGGVFELVSEAGAAVVIVHASSARVAGPPTGGSSVELRVCEGDEVEVVGRALWAASTREVGRGGLRGNARELHLHGTAGEPLCMRVVRKREAKAQVAATSEKSEESQREPDASALEAREGAAPTGVRVELATSERAREAPGEVEEREAQHDRQGERAQRS